MVTEIDVFLADDPKLLLSRYTVQEIEQRFGPLDDQTYPAAYSLPEYDQYLDRFLQNLWRKYGRVSLISGRLYDEVKEEYITLFDPDHYSILALRRLRDQLLPGSELHQILDRKIQKELSENTIVMTLFLN